MDAAPKPRPAAAHTHAVRADTYIACKSPEASVRFYVEELKLFRVAQDFGMGIVLLDHVDNPNFCLMLDGSRQPQLGHPVFSMSTADCAAEFERLAEVRFAKGGFLSKPGEAPVVMEFPLGRSFLMIDPSENIFMVSEWFAAPRPQD